MPKNKLMGVVWEFYCLVIVSQISNFDEGLQTSLIDPREFHTRWHVDFSPKAREISKKEYK